MKITTSRLHTLAYPYSILPYDCLDNVTKSVTKFCLYSIIGVKRPSNLIRYNNLRNPTAASCQEVVLLPQNLFCRCVCTSNNALKWRSCVASRVGQQFGNYQLIQFLGKGSFAEVYLGGHIHLGTLAAVKVLQT